MRTTLVAIMCGIGFLAAGNAFAQTIDRVGQLPDLSGTAPRDNVRGSALRERAPGNWVNAARQRHNDLIAERLTSRRFGTNDPNEPSDPNTGGDSGGGDGETDGGGLFDSISGLLDSVGGVGGASSILDALGGAGLGSGASGDSSIAPDSLNLDDGAVAGSSSAGDGRDNLPMAKTSLTGRGPIEVMAKAREARLAELGVSTKQSGTAQATNPDDEEPRFLIRWADALLQTTFTSLAFAFQTDTFITIIEDALRPIFLPESLEEASAATQPAAQTKRE